MQLWQISAKSNTICTTRAKRAGIVAQEVEHLLIMCEAPGSNPSATTKEKKMLFVSWINSCPPLGSKSPATLEVPVAID
jgi:hypothetical protein